MTKLHIYIFRHGRTYFNVAQRFTGWKDSRLNSSGFADAKKIARKLHGKRIDVAYQTHLSRSRDTLKEVLKYHPECREVVTDDRMLERRYGKLEGMSHKRFVEREGTDDYKTLLHWHKVDHLHGKEREEFVRKIGDAELKVVRRSYDVRPPGGESVKDVEKRVRAFIKDLLNKMKKDHVNVAISGHGNSMRPFRRYFENLSVKEMMELENPWDDYFEYIIRG